MAHQVSPSPSTDAALSINQQAQLALQDTNAASSSQTQDALDHVISQLVPLNLPSPALAPAAAGSLRGISWTSQQPFLYFTVPSTGLSGFSNVITLGAGNIWFQDSYFASNSPASGYLGLQLVSGVIQYTTVMNLSQDPIVAPAATSAVLTVTCKLAPPPTQLNPSISVMLPQNVVFTFGQSGVGTLVSSDNASITVFSSTVSLTRPTTSPPSIYDTPSSRIQFPFTPNPTHLSFPNPIGIAKLQSGSNTLVPIIGASWDLPLTTVQTATGSPTPETQLSTATSTVGGLGLQLGVGLNATFLGTSISLGAANILLDPITGLSITGTSARFSSRGPKIGLWDSSSSVSLTSPSTVIPFRYSNLSNQEVWALEAQVTCQLDQPRNVNNDRMYYSSIGVAALRNNGEAASGTTITIIGIANSTRQRVVSGYAIKNLLLKENDPDTLEITGLLSSVTLPSSVLGGSLVISSQLRYILPFLPDPYTTNIQFLPGEATDTGTLGAVVTTIGWNTPTTGPTIPTIDISLPPKVLSGLREIAADPNDPVVPPLPQADQTALQQQSLSFGQAVGNAQSRQLLNTGAMFLDLSTSVSQFGVLFTLLNPDLESSVNSTTAPVSVSNLLLSAPADEIGVMTLPSVQWEPIVTDPTDDSENPIPPNTYKFPTPLYFPDSGPPTIFGQNSVTLTPIAPRYAIDGLLENYNTKTGTPSNVGVRFTLPSGIVSVAALQRTNVIFPLFTPPALLQVQPTFSDISQTPAVGLTGGDQLSIRAPHRLLVIPSGGQTASPSFSGSTYQLQNGLTSLGTAATPSVSALGSTVDAIFNKQFGPQGSAPAVPVLRADFSGWGESLFSDWSDPNVAQATAPGVSKARFDVITGRTVTEVVQVFSDMVPCAVRTVATATITRLNSGVMLRRTDWKAISDGHYKFMNPAIVSHPGVVQAVTNVVNIHDTGERITTVGGYGWAGVSYDCTVLLENTVIGQVGTGVPCTGLLGYVQVNSPGTTNTAFTPADYNDLISKVGPKMTASIDCSINIGLSGQIMHISHFGPSAAMNTAGAPEFPMAASGSLQLKSGTGAQWGFVSQSITDVAPQAVDAVAGVPLIRNGPVSSAVPALPPPATPQPYRFAGGADMFVVGTGTPLVEYSLVYATGSQRVAFRRPKIEADGLNRITSVVFPLLADMFALGTSTGPFPQATVCLPLAEPTGQDYFLQISTGGNLKLSLNPITIPLDGNTRIIANSANYTNTVYASRSLQSWAPEGTVQQPPTVITLAIDTASATLPWSVSVTNLIVASSIEKFGEMYDYSGSLAADSSTPSSFTDTALIFGPGLQPVQKLVQVLKKFGPMTPMTINMTNEWGFQAMLGIDFAELEKILPPPLSTLLPAIIDELSLHVGVTGTLESVEAVVELDASIKIPVSAFFVVLIFKCSANFGSNGSVMELDAGGGLGMQYPLGPFLAEGYVAQTLDLQIGLAYGVGTTLITKAEVKFTEWLKIEVDFEAKGCLIDSPCAAGATIWCYFQISIGLEITLFAFVQIDFQVQTEWDKALESPAVCPLVHA